MEGWDGTAEGRPTDLIRRRWARFGGGGAGLVWGEATAVRPDGRANPHQLLLDRTTVGGLRSCGPSSMTIRWPGFSSPTPAGGRARRGPAPKVAYHHPCSTRGSSGERLDDDELDQLVEAFDARPCGPSGPGSTSWTSSTATATCSTSCSAPRSAGSLRRRSGRPHAVSCVRSWPIRRRAPTLASGCACGLRPRPVPRRARRPR